MKRVCEMTDLELIKEIDDDAVAREVSKRLGVNTMKVSDEIQRLENQILKLKVENDKLSRCN